MEKHFKLVYRLVNTTNSQFWLPLTAEYILNILKKHSLLYSLSGSIMAPCDSKETTPQENPASPPEKTNQLPEKKPFKRQIVWINVGFMILLHAMGVYGIILLPRLKLLTILWIIVLHHLGGLGITMGAHRLWSHRSYKAKWPLRLILMCVNSLAAQNDIFEWCRDHRVHHKYSETDGDPHNAKRGLFFSHVGWLLQRKHPDVITKGKGIDLSDLYADEIVMFQRRYLY